MIEISMCMAVWMTSHLLKRSVQSYLRQDIDPSRWELIIIDDNSPDDVGAACEALLASGLNVTLRRLDHAYGMRGNTVSFNTAFEMARGHILAETTPETLLPRDGIRRLLEPHAAHPRAFVAMKTYNLTIKGQRAIDTVDWASDAMHCAGLPEWDSAWTQNNVRVVHFGTHQTCSIRKDVFYEMTKGRGFPLFGDYGCLDPSTRILTADLQWVRQDAVREGDLVVGVSEHQPRGTKRKFEAARVLRVGEVRLPSIRIVTDDGRDIVASCDHPWLVVGEGGSSARWVPTQQLQLGSAIKRVADVWVAPDPFESGWVAGALDGEGSASSDSGLRVTFTQNPGPVLDRYMEILARWGVDCQSGERPHTPKKPSDWSSRDGVGWNVRTRRQEAAFKLLGLAPAVRLVRKWEGCGLPIGDGGGMVSRVVHLEQVGERTLVGMHTSTRTFIAEGLVTHNSEDPWYSGRRPLNNILDVTLPNEYMAVHQWHPPFQYWQAKGHAPYLNRWAHSTSNYLHDTSGEVPNGGTCEIWDQGSREKLPEAERTYWRGFDQTVIELGVPEHLTHDVE